MICNDALIKAKLIDEKAEKQRRLEQEHTEEIRFVNKYLVCPRCGNDVIKIGQILSPKLECKQCKAKYDIEDNNTYY